MKNIFKKAIKVLNDSEKVIISRYDEYYIITNSYIALKVAPLFYDAYFRTEKPYFVELESGECWISYKYERKHSIGSNMNFVDIDYCFKPNEVVSVKRTPYKKAAQCITAKNQMGMVDLFTANDFISGLDSKFVEAFDDIFDESIELKGSGKFAPIIWEADNASGVILPVRIEITEVEDTIIKMFRAA